MPWKNNDERQRRNKRSEKMTTLGENEDRVSRSKLIDKEYWQTSNGDDVEVLGTAVVRAVHHGSNGKTECDAELSSGGSSTSRHDSEQANKTLFQIECE